MLGQSGLLWLRPKLSEVPCDLIGCSLKSGYERRSFLWTEEAGTPQSALGRKQQLRCGGAGKSLRLHCEAISHLWSWLRGLVGELLAIQIM